VEVTQVIDEERVSAQDGLCCLHGDHAFLTLFSAWTLLEAHAEETIEIAVAAVFLLGVVNFLKDGAFELLEIPGVVLEAVIGEVVRHAIQQILKPVKRNKLDLGQIDQLCSD